jgi:hypothetical protein
MWIPAEYSLVDYGRALAEAEAANDTSDLLFVWAKRGSTAMTTTGGVVLNPAHELEHQAYPPPPSPPPSPPSPPALPPAPPTAPPSPPALPPAQVRAISVAQDFSIAGAESAVIVDDLSARMDEIEVAVRVFVSNLTAAEVLISTNVDSLRNESSGPANATSEPELRSRSRRRLGEEGEPGACENGARLEVSIQFITFVEVEVVERIKDEWARLVNSSSWNTTACNEPTFDTEVATPGPADAPREDQTAVLAIALSVGGAALLCCCCGGAALFARKRGKRKRELYEKATTSSAPKKTPKSPYTKVETSDDVTQFKFQL